MSLIYSLSSLVGEIINCVCVASPESAAAAVARSRLILSFLPPLWGASGAAAAATAKRKIAQSFICHLPSTNFIQTSQSSVKSALTDVAGSEVFWRKYIFGSALCSASDQLMEKCRRNKLTFAATKI